MSPDTYQTILAQHHLRETGYYPEKIDGRDSVDGAWGPISTTSCKRWFTDLDKSKITNPFVGILRALAAQFELANAGLYGGRLDGLWGPLSKKASAEALTMDLGLATPSRPPIVQDTRHQSLPYDVAKQHLGQKEIPGKANNPLILRWLRALASWVTSEETAWCSAFVDYCAREAGYESTGSLAARSWLNVGEFVPLSEARKGDVIILWRVSRTSWQGHVAFLDHHNTKRGLLYLLGGNQNNEVNITAYPEDRLLGVRRLRTLDQLQGSARSV